MINIEAKDLDGIISTEQGALIIISILYEQGVLNQITYDSIKKKYNIT